MGPAARHPQYKPRLARAHLLHCVDDQGLPLLGPPKKGREIEEFLRNAHTDVPDLVETMRQYWMPTRYARARTYHG
ncbi:hypothetical protein [Bradyrhizobium sp. USDA 4454]